jgi:hypothetical protein
MKKSTNALAAGAVSLVTLFLTACPGVPTEPSAPTTPKSVIPFQGPMSPSFEQGGWVVSGTPAGLCNLALKSTRALIVTGTGFLPSHGISYLSINSCNFLETAPDAYAYQDQVYLDHSTTLSFDYTLSGTVAVGAGRAVAQILFTSTGTTTLWTKTITSTSILPIQKLTETVTLPATTMPGRLTIRLDVFGSGSGPVVTKSDVTFGVDNIVVK